MNKFCNTEKRRWDIPTSANHMWFPDFRETRNKTQVNYGTVSSAKGEGGNPKWLQSRNTFMQNNDSLYYHLHIS